MNIPKYLIVHHSGGGEINPLVDTSGHTFETVNEYHRGLWNFPSSLGFYIGYHYYIEKSGKVTQGRADTDEGAHCIGKNKESIGICLAGNFDLTVPTKEQVGALKELLSRKRVEWAVPIENIVPHRKFADKSCYGKNLSDDWCQGILADSKKDRALKLLLEAVELLK